MPPFPDFAVRQLQRSDVPLMGAMMTVFGDAFKEADTYTGLLPVRHTWSASSAAHI